MPTPPAPSPDAIHRSDRTALRVSAAIALACAVVGLVAPVVAAVMPLLTDEGLVIELLLAPGASVGDASLVPAIRSIAPESALVALEISAISGGALALLLVERALIGIIVALVAASIGYALLRVSRGEAFHRSLFAVTTMVGAVLSIGMMIAVGLGGLGRMMAASELNEVLGGEQFVLGFAADFTPVLVGIVVVGLAYVFRIGERLQRDTAGLV